MTRSQDNEATIAKITVKKILNQIDYIEILLGLGEPDNIIKETLVEWLNDIRILLRRLEHMAEQSAQ